MYVIMCDASPNHNIVNDKTNQSLTSDEEFNNNLKSMFGSVTTFISLVQHHIVLTTANYFGNHTLFGIPNGSS